MIHPDYNYKLTDSLIAHEPADPRDASRLFVYKVATNEIAFSTSADLAKFVPADSILVLNNTKVVPARLALSKSTGGLVRILFLLNEWGNGESNKADNSYPNQFVNIRGLPDKGIEIGETLYWKTNPPSNSDPIPVVKAISHSGSEFTFELLVSA